ncbi:diaminopimelate decarboxylase [uncultured Corynebacterium sp.]|uniref:diaminopimelate decarboxylase family protein n=1 Tax=uncultured Corynebacterium sp. TaxID=159447 RepID=UPI0025EAF49D|nr:diaminopimelate decarboxylase [uncultured Corynebacterium sp.]
MNAHRDDDGQVSIAGVRLADVANKYGTPLMVVDEDDFRARCRAMAGAFDGPGHVHYASKAFLTVGIARWVASEGLCLDVASDGELDVALRAGFPPERITVHGNNKLDRTLIKAVQAGVGHIVIDSRQEVDRLGKIAREANARQEVLIRVTPGVHADTHEFIATSHEDQKFGLSLASGAAKDAVLAAMDYDSLAVAGLHCHVGSQVFDADGFSLAAERLLGLMADLHHELGRYGTSGGVGNHDSMSYDVEKNDVKDSLDILDLGGGYGIAYSATDSPLDVQSVADDLKARVHKAASELHFDPPTLMVEPGRAIAGPSTVTVYTVGTIKDVPTDERSTRRYVAVDGGMSDNIRPALYNAHYDGRVINRLMHGNPIPTRLVGSHCESGDILVEDAIYPDDIEVGDRIALAGTGAYCFSMSSRYNMFCRPAVVAVRDGHERVMVRRETIDDLLALDEDC